MKAILGMLLLSIAPAFADVSADRAAIEEVVKSLSTANPVSVLFTADADSQLDRLKQSADGPWSEVFHPTSGRPSIAIQSIRFLTPEIALVDAASIQIGSVVLMRRVPVWLVMKKEAR
jgi:hypothetical protein